MDDDRQIVRSGKVDEFLMAGLEHVVVHLLTDDGIVLCTELLSPSDCRKKRLFWEEIPF